MRLETFTSKTESTVYKKERKIISQRTDIIGDILQK